jgi:hypothetical protein
MDPRCKSEQWRYQDERVGVDMEKRRVRKQPGRACGLFDKIDPGAESAQYLARKVHWSLSKGRRFRARSDIKCINARRF